MNVEIEGRELLRPESWADVDKVIKLSQKERIPVAEVLRAFHRWHPVLFSLEGIRSSDHALWEVAYCDPKVGAFTVSWDGFVRNQHDQAVYRWKTAYTPTGSFSDDVRYYRPSRCFDAMAWCRAAAMLEQRADRYFEEQRRPLYDEVLQEVLRLPSRSVPYIYQGRMHSWSAAQYSPWGECRDEFVLSNAQVNKDKSTLARLGQTAGLNSPLSRKAAELARRTDVYRRKQNAYYDAYAMANEVLSLYLPRRILGNYDPFLVELQTPTRRVFFDADRSLPHADFGNPSLKMRLLTTSKTKHIIVRIKD